MLAWAKTSLPSKTNGGSSSSWMRLAVATAIAVGGRLEEDRELVATDARDGVGCPDRRGESCTDRSQQAVAREVAEAVVDVLEVVEVEEEHRHRRVGAVATVEGVHGSRAEEGAVRQPRDAVVECLVGQLVLEQLALADVPRR